MYVCIERETKRERERGAPTRFFNIFAAELARPGVVPWPQRPDAAAPLQPGQLMQVAGIEIYERMVVKTIKKWWLNHQK